MEIVRALLTPRFKKGSPGRSRESRRGSSGLTILHLLAPASFGGIESVVSALAAGHAATGNSVHVLAVVDRASDDNHRFLARLRDVGVDVVQLVLPPRGYLQERSAVRRWCERINPDVVHTHGYRPDVVDAGVARGLGIATVTTVHGFSGGDWKNRLYERLQHIAFRRFDAVVAVSRPLYEGLLAGGISSERLQLIPNAWAGGVQLVERTVARSELGVPQDRFHIGWVGRLCRAKGADIWIEALALLRDLPLAATIIGDGSERDNLERRVAELGLRDLVRFTGQLDTPARYFSAFDAFVLSSRTEGTPIVLFEAMAAVVPIIATRVGGVPDVVTPEESLLIPAGDPRALAEAVRATYGDLKSASARARVAQGGLSERFALEPWLTRYDRLYRRIATAM